MGMSEKWVSLPNSHYYFEIRQYPCTRHANACEKYMDMYQHHLLDPVPLPVYMPIRLSIKSVIMNT